VTLQEQCIYNVVANVQHCIAFLQPPIRIKRSKMKFLVLCLRLYGGNLRIRRLWSHRSQCTQHCPYVIFDPST